MIDARSATLALLHDAVCRPARHRADGDAARGEARFQDCAACHKLEAGANDVGPSLHGIFARKAGELADFRYSPAMKRSGIIWTPETLDKFITDPQAMVPGNRMPYAGMAERDRPRRSDRLSVEGVAIGPRHTRYALSEKSLYVEALASPIRVKPDVSISITANMAGAICGHLRG